MSTLQMLAHTLGICETTQQLHLWRDSLFYGEWEKARVHQAQLAQKIAEERDEIKNWYDLYSLNYYRVMEMPDCLAAVMQRLEARQADFDQAQMYWYLRQLGIRDMTASYYNDAMAHFVKAETLGNNLGLNKDEGLYVNMGQCLTDMGYAAMAIAYLEKAQVQAAKRHNNNYSILTRSLLGLNYLRVGRIDESLQLQQGCLRDERRVNTASLTLVFLYRRLAQVYLAQKDYPRAMENINASLKNATAHKGAHNDSLYWKAQIFFSQGEKQAGMDCLTAGIWVEKRGTIYATMLHAAQHCHTMHKTKSRLYVKKFAIPKLERHGLYLPLMDCYEALGEHRLAFNLSEKLRKGEFTC